MRDRPYLCYNENNKEQCCSTCQQLFTDIEGGTISLLKFFITVLLVSIQHLPANMAYIWLENFNLIMLFGYNLLVNKISEVNVVSARSLPFFSYIKRMMNSLLKPQLTSIVRKDQSN